eukprot:scaffold112790_cov19-Tisochrysis_lutea.AAC.1
MTVLSLHLDSFWALFPLCTFVWVIPNTHAGMKHQPGRHDQAIDVLRSGLGMFPEKQGIDFARLMAMTASIETDRSNW